MKTISGGQVVAMMFWTIMGTAIITLPVLIAMHAPRDAWMAAIIFIIGGICISFVIRALSRRFPDYDFAECVEKVFGKWLGKLLLVVFLVWISHTTYFVLYQINIFTRLTLLPNTPLIVIELLFIAPVVFALYAGIERLARTSQFIFMLTIGIVFILYIFHISDANFENLLPILDDGIYNVVRSGLAPLAWAGEIMFVLFFVPNIKNSEKTGLYSMLTIILIGVGGILNESFYTLVFGELRQYLSSPFYSIVRYIRPTLFIERFDILFASIELTGNFIKLGVFIFVIVFCLSRILGLKSYRPLILPAVILLIAGIELFPLKQAELISFLDGVFPFYTIPLLYGLPLLTLIVAKIRKV
ncbi:MAG: spore germination protein [Clostridia bacterium]|nr:spore germination protein [Clostridia bacterium]